MASDDDDYVDDDLSDKVSVVSSSGAASADNGDKDKDKKKKKQDLDKFSAAKAAAHAVSALVDAGLASKDYRAWKPSLVSLDYPKYSEAEFVAHSMNTAAAQIRHLVARISSGERHLTTVLEGVLIGADIYAVGFHRPEPQWEAKDLSKAMSNAKKLELRATEIIASCKAAANADVGGLVVKELAAREATYNGGMVQQLNARKARAELALAGAGKSASTPSVTELVRTPHQAAVKASLQWLDRDLFGVVQHQTLLATFEAVKLQPQLYDRRATPAVQFYERLCNVLPLDRAATFEGLETPTTPAIIQEIMKRAKVGGFIDGDVYLELLTGLAA